SSNSQLRLFMTLMPGIFSIEVCPLNLHIYINQDMFLYMEHLDILQECPDLKSVEDLTLVRNNNIPRSRHSSSSSDSSHDSRSTLCTKRRLHYAQLPPRTNPRCSPHVVHSPAFRQQLQARIHHERNIRNRRRKSRGGNQDINYMECGEDTNPTRSGVGVRRQENSDTNQEEREHLLLEASHHIFEHRETQMRAIVDKLSLLEQEFRHEQDMIWKEMHRKEERIDNQARKIAELDNANTILSLTISQLHSQ
ncbi:hypothetical protein SK128_024117, partial [Halocaridina rubra]